MRIAILGLMVLVLAGCGGAPAAQVTAQGAAEAIKAAGVAVADIKPLARAEGEPTPNSYQERVEFSIAEVAPKGGQVFVCDTKKNCDAIYAYYDALKGLAGPYLYQSQGGRVVAQLNSGLSPETAAKAEAAIKALP